MKSTYPKAHKPLQWVKRTSKMVPWEHPCMRYVHYISVPGDYQDDDTYGDGTAYYNDTDYLGDAEQCSAHSDGNPSCSVWLIPGQVAE